MRKIFVTFQREGIHQYHNAPDAVAYLRFPHRHMFHFKVTMEVYHDDREVEFIMFKHELENLYSSDVMQLDFRSCEMIADDIAFYLNHKYPERWYEIEVSEDGENGAILTKE